MTEEAADQFIIKYFGKEVMYKENYYVMSQYARDMLREYFLKDIVYKKRYELNNFEKVYNISLVISKYFIDSIVSNEYLDRKMLLKDITKCNEVVRETLYFIIRQGELVNNKKD